MKALLVVALVAAACCAVLSRAGILSATNLVAPLFGAALVFVLLDLMNVSDRRY